LINEEFAMRHADTLVSVGLPVCNGAERIDAVVQSVLNQDHENIELVICDNASTDDTEELCRHLASRDSRIVYHRNPTNVGLLNNFIGAMRLANGSFFRWVGDDDWLAPNCVSRSLDAFAADDRLILVTCQVEYTGSDGVTRSGSYRGDALSSDDPITRFCEMLRILNQSYMLIDTLYGLFKREPLLSIKRRNMLREDQVFATKLALAGPSGHVPELLARRHWKDESAADLARKLDVPQWRTHIRTMLQCREMLQWLDECDLDDQQRRRGRLAVAHMYLRRQQLVLSRRGRKLKNLTRELARIPSTSPRFEIR
jgi:glycosyltransferase involved in cell wall biosynthesis